VALPQYPRVMLPIILYNLVQHLVAGSIDFLFFRRLPLNTEEDHHELRQGLHE